uniref:Uncharacterized protein n=1 Tax=Caenorhabditis japonica TaxID=281687 RepID=A0A8R1ETQ3_CAEJA
MKSQPYPYPTNANQWMMPVTHEQINNSFQKACASTTTANSSVFKMVENHQKAVPKTHPAATIALDLDPLGIGLFLSQLQHQLLLRILLSVLA